MPDQYLEFHSAQSASVLQAEDDFSLTTDSSERLGKCFLNGCYGDDNSNVTLMEGESAAASQCNADGVAWFGSNPNKPLPPKP